MTQEADLALALAAQAGRLRARPPRPMSGTATGDHVERTAWAAANPAYPPEPVDTGPSTLLADLGLTETNPYELARWPRVVDGIVVPSLTLRLLGAVRAEDTGFYAPNLATARQVKGGIPIEFTPASQIATVRTTTRAVGAFLAGGHWLVLWVGTDKEERDAALVAFLRELSATKSVKSLKR